VRQTVNQANIMMNGEKTFLLVEDDPYDVVFVEEEFRRARGSARLRVACDGVEAMHYVSGHGNYADRRKYPKPDVILLDLKMPVMDGWTFRREQRRDPAIADIPVVVLSGADAEQVPELAAAAWFDKPVSIPQVISAIRRLCENL